MSEQQQTPWLVWNPKHGFPKCQHRTYEEAEREAKRLAACHPGQEFLVMGAAVKVARHDVVVTPVNHDIIPF